MGTAQSRLLPNLRLDDLLAELQVRLQVVLAAGPVTSRHSGDPADPELGLRHHALPEPRLYPRAWLGPAS